MSLTLPSQSRAASTPSITVNALTTLFTPPPECATQWIAFSRGDIYAPKETYIQRIVEETYIDVSSCYPTSTISRDELYRSYRSLIYSPGICPSGFTTAHSIYSSDNGSMRATCCADGYTLNTVNGGRYLVYSTGRYCTSEYTSATSALRLNEDGFHTTLAVTVPTAVGPGIAVLDAVTVLWEVSDLSLFPGNAKPVVGPEVVALLGSEKSLVLGPGDMTSVVGRIGSTATRSMPTTSSRNKGGRMRGQRVLIMGVLGLVPLIVHGLFQ